MARNRITKITEAPRGQIAEIIHTPLPDKKEELEEYLARRFVEKFNSELPLGPGVRIAAVCRTRPAIWISLSKAQLQTILRLLS